jgi:phospholipid/cholesterol/gamma-HCH transport system permease protein
LFQFIGKAGQWAIGKISFWTGLLSLLFYSFTNFFKPGTKGKKFVFSIAVTQIYFTGVQAIWLISIIGLAIGVALIFQINQLGSMVADKLGQILVIVIIRMLGPLLTAVVVVARSGTAIATEIATMQLRHETQALEILGVDTLLYIVLPRIIGMVVSLLFLNIYLNVISIFGGISVAMLLDRSLTYVTFFTNFFEYLTVSDIVEFVLKSIFFGCGISLICIINGFKVELYQGGIPFAGLKGVVGSLVYVFFIDTLLTVLFIL